MGSVYVGQSNSIRFVWSFILFLDSLFLPFCLLGCLRSIDVAGVLQEAGDADLRACIWSKCKLNMSSFLALPHSLHCPICGRNTMFIVSCDFLLCSCFVFKFLAPLIRWLEQDSWVCFFVTFLLHQNPYFPSPGIQLEAQKYQVNIIFPSTFWIKRSYFQYPKSLKQELFSNQ